MAFKDLSHGNENILSSTVLTGDIELKSPAGISLYPDSDNSGDDKIVWLRDGAKLVFEGPIADPREIKIQAPEPTGLPQDTLLTLPTINGTFALISDVTDSESALTAYIDARDAATLISANTYTDDRETAITIAYQTYTDTAEADAIATSNSYTDAAVSSGTGSLTTDDIPEASNLYYTDLRVQTYLTDNNYTTEAYVDQAEADAITASNAYTDIRETAITSAYQTYTDTAELDAVATSNSYTDGRETVITSAYQAYADTAEADATTYTDTRETVITSAYQAYADTAEADANTYTDTRETAITSAYQTYTDTAEADANTYTDTRETVITSAYQAYADTAEADAISTSTTFALSAANAAKADANTYTDTRETAITSAYQTYTDTAEADAIATASADATSKANTAETSANAYTDTRETAITIAYQTYTDTAESDAIATANSYTDTRETAITSAYQTYTDTAESDAIATANSYTDTQVTKTVIDALGIQASSVDANSVALGTDTTGNYVAGVSGTLNEIEVSGSGSETASVTVGLPANVSVTNDLTVGGDLFVTGTTVSIGAANLSVDDSFIYLNQGDAIGADNTVFTGTGLDDASFEGYYEGTTTTTYYVRIDGTGATDTFEWSKDNFATTEATGIAITGGEQDLDNNIKFHASATTGHTLGDVWSGTAAPLAVDTGIFSNINTGTSAPGYTHIGVFYDASATRWKVFSEYAPEPNGDINTGDASFVLGAMEADCFIAREVDLTQAPVDNSHATTKLYVDNADIAVAAAATAANASLQSTLQANIDTKLNATANAVSASKWDTARIITLGGDASGNVSIDGSQNVTLSVTVSDDSHNHTITNVDGLQTALDAKVDDSQVLTNVPAGAVFTDTVYTHPTSHPISFITGLQTALDAKVDDSQVLTNVPAGAVFTDTVYTHPTSHPISFITGLQTALNNKVDDSQVLTNVPSGAVFTDTVYTHPTSHPISFITGLQTALNAKVDDSQVLTNVPSGALFTDTVYTHPTSHPISFITGLQTALDGKLGSTANAVSASKWNTARTITLGGDLSGNVSIDGSQNVTLNAEVTNDSHTHDGRYYTESESDSRFINTDGDTMTGILTIGTVAGEAGTLNITGDIVATGDVTAFSDRRFKHNVVQIDNALEKVKALRGVSFEKDNRMSIGVIAQEVEEVIPEVVHTNDEGLKSVAYGNIVGVLIEAIKEQNLKIEELKQEIDKLNGKI